MKRRQFIETMAASSLLLPFAGKHTPTPPVAPRRPVKPRRLRAGDTIGLITPGSYLDDEGLQKSVQNLESMGLVVKMGRNIRAERGFIAGSDAQRLEDLHAMFADPSVAAVWCARGGYGCSRLLPDIDYALIRRNPKPLIGYSDITALLQAVHQRTGLIGFHGPVGASDLTDYTKAQLMAVLFEGAGPYAIPLAAASGTIPDPPFTPFTITPGKARGVLAGGNLILLAALTGTGFSPDVEGRLLFIEDVGERPYRVDRMLTQLRQALPLQKAAGIALGVFADCEPKPSERSLTLEDTLRDRLGDLGIPVLYGLSFGHIANQCTLPVGIQAELDVEGRTITLLEAAVTD